MVTSGYTFQGYLAQSQNLVSCNKYSAIVSVKNYLFLYLFCELKNVEGNNKKSE